MPFRNWYSDGTIERFGFCHVISEAIFAFRGWLLPFYVSQSCWWLRFSFAFYYGGDCLGVPLPEVSYHCFRSGIRFHLFWPQIRSGFSVDFRIWLGKLLKLFSYSCIENLMQYTGITIILSLVFINWLTAHCLINYFTLNACVSGVRIWRSGMVIASKSVDHPF